MRLLQLSVISRLNVLAPPADGKSPYLRGVAKTLLQSTPNIGSLVLPSALALINTCASRTCSCGRTWDLQLSEFPTATSSTLRIPCTNSSHSTYLGHHVFTPAKLLLFLFVSGLLCPDSATHRLERLEHGLMGEF